MLTCSYISVTKSFASWEGKRCLFDVFSSGPLLSTMVGVDCGEGYDTHPDSRHRCSYIMERFSPLQLTVLYVYVTCKSVSGIRAKSPPPLASYRRFNMENKRGWNGNTVPNNTDFLEKHKIKER